jgi:hypothetical protein
VGFQNCATGAARYREEYVKQNGEWKFKDLKVVSSFWTLFDQGWVKKQFIHSPYATGAKKV